MSFYAEQQQNQTNQLSPYNMDYFHSIKNQVDQINYQLKHIDHFRNQRQQKFKKSIKQYKKYLQNQRKGIQKNQMHCKLRNDWYKQQIKKAWQMSISNRTLILRSLARTNVLKRDADQWIARIDDNVFLGNNQEYNFIDKFSRISKPQQYNHNLINNNSVGHQNQLKGSKLISKYNDILRQYQHKI